MLVVAGCALVAVVAVCFFCFRENEPSYNGRTLSEWLEEITVSRIAVTEQLEEQKAIEAVRAIGTNALPFFVKWSGYGSTPLEADLVNVGRCIPGIRNTSVFRRIAFRHVKKRSAAIKGFRILKDKAALVVPELITRLNRTKNYEKALGVASMLQCVGEPAVPALIKAAESGSLEHRSAAMYALSGMGTFACDAVPALLEIGRNLSDPAHNEAAATVGKMAGCSDQAISTFSNMLASATPGDRICALIGLTTFVRWQGATSIQQTVPAIKLALEDSDIGVRYWAKEALTVIAPQALTNSASSNN